MKVLIIDLAYLLGTHPLFLLFQGIDPPEQKEIGAALEAVIKDMGEMGLYQKLLFVGMMPFGFVWAFVYLGHMFVTPTPQEHWCRVPELAGLALELRFVSYFRTKL